MSPHTKKIVDELCNYLGYDFESPMCRELHDHIQECEECQKYIDSIKKTVKICQKSLTPEPVPDAVKQKILERIKSGK